MSIGENEEKTGQRRKRVRTIFYPIVGWNRLCYDAPMPRPLRPIADGLVYHVINRGNNRQPVFHDEGDYAAFLKALADLKERKPFELYGYCLMGNHIHLLLRPREGSVSRIVQSLLVSHTQRYHRFHRSSGHVWQGRFKSPVIQDDDHLLAVLRYIEANPLRARLVEQADKHRWSSFANHGGGAPTPSSTRWRRMKRWRPTRQCDSGGGRPLSTRPRTRPSWRPSVAAARAGCRMGGVNGWTNFADN